MLIKIIITVRNNTIIIKSSKFTVPYQIITRPFKSLLSTLQPAQPKNGGEGYKRTGPTVKLWRVTLTTCKVFLEMGEGYCNRLSLSFWSCIFSQRLRKSVLLIDLKILREKFQLHRSSIENQLKIMDSWSIYSRSLKFLLKIMIQTSPYLR
jgi:hypothetical protein